MSGQPCTATLQHAWNPAVTYQRVLAHWYSRAPRALCYSGATCHTTAREISLETFQSLGPAHRRVPGDRRLHRHPGAHPGSNGGRQQRRCRPRRRRSSRPRPSPSGLGSRPTRSRPSRSRSKAATPTPSATSRRSSARRSASRSWPVRRITARTLSGGTQGQILDIEVPAGKRAITVEVDQVTGVGTTIKTGDYVDMVVGITGDRFPVITTNPADNSFYRRRRHQRHEREAAAPGHAGARHVAPATARPGRGPRRSSRRPASPARR